MRTLLYLAVCSIIALAASPRRAQPPVLHAAVIDGDGALNSLQNRGAHQAVVRVEDSDGKPVTGAYVEFDTPRAGPGANFANGSTHFATTTNGEGLASVSGFQNNGVAGSFSILVHVSYQGLTVAELTVHQTNLRQKVAEMSSSVQQDEKSGANKVVLSSNVLGIALGDQFSVNGVPTPSNANLLQGHRVQTQNSPVTIYLHDHCEFLVGPHSAVVVQPQVVSVSDGAVRAKHFGNCKLGYGGLWITSPVPNGDAVMALSSENMEVGSVSGQLEISNALGLVGTVQPGTVSTFTFSTTTAASGAAINTPLMTPRTAFMLGTGVGAAMTGLGIAVAAIEQPASTSP